MAPRVASFGGECKHAPWERVSREGESLQVSNGSSDPRGTKLRVGVVGCGRIAETHIPYIRRAGGELVGVADLSLVRANELADRFSVQNVYRRLDDLIEAERPHVVHVLTPPHTHAAVAMEAMEQGCHVLVEKPMATRDEDARAMVAAAQRAGVLLTVDHNRLFDPPMLAARELIARGDLGEVVGAEAFQAGEASEREWLSEVPGAGLGDLLPHPLYLLLAFAGDVEVLDALLLRPAATAGEELRVMMRSDERVIQLSLSTNTRPFINVMRLYGTRMSLEVDFNNMLLLVRRDYDVPKVVAKVLPSLDTSWQLLRQTVRNGLDFVRGKARYYPGMGNVIDRFYAAIRGGGELPVLPEEGRAVVAVTERIWAAAARRDEQAMSAPGPDIAAGG